MSFSNQLELAALTFMVIIRCKSIISHEQLPGALKISRTLASNSEKSYISIHCVCVGILLHNPSQFLLTLDIYYYTC